MSKPQTHRSSGGLLMVFLGFIVLVFGLFLTRTALRDTLLYWQSREWVRVPALIEEVRIDESTDSDDGKTYAVRGSYTYRYDNRDWRGTRIEIDEDFRSTRKRIDAMKAVLDKHRDTKKPIEILVDPKNPAASLIFREISHMMLVMPMFGLIFTISGISVIGSGVWRALASRRTAARVKTCPDQPWKWEGLWDRCRVVHSNLWSAVTTLAATTGANLCLWIYIAALFVESDLPDFVLWLFAALGVCGCLAFVVPLDMLRRWWRYGNPTLLFEQVPVRPGETLKVVLLLRSKLVPTEGMRATLYCNRIREEPTAEEPSTVTVNLWSETRTMREDLNRTHGSTAIPIVFQIPPELPARDMYAEPQINWRLEVQAIAPELPGVPGFEIKPGDHRGLAGRVVFQTEFEIPVFHVSRPELVEYRSQTTDSLDPRL